MVLVLKRLASEKALEALSRNTYLPRVKKQKTGVLVMIDYKVISYSAGVYA